MDPSTQAAQDVQNQTSSSATPVSDEQQKTTPTQQMSLSDIAQNGLSGQTLPQNKAQISVSGGGIEAEAGGAMIVPEDPDEDSDEEEALKGAPQEKKNQALMGVGGDEQDEDQQPVSQAPVIDIQEESEIQPAVPEITFGNPEVEKIVEITPPEAPKISEELKDIVTHSGPGIIDVSEVNLKPKPLPVTYTQVITEEEKIKENRLHNSKFWLLEKIKYLWRKVNPDIDTTVKKQATQQTVIAQENPVPVNPESLVNNTKQI